MMKMRTRSPADRSANGTASQKDIFNAWYIAYHNSAYEPKVLMSCQRARFTEDCWCRATMLCHAVFSAGCRPALDFAFTVDRTTTCSESARSKAALPRESWSRAAGDVARSLLRRSACRSGSLPIRSSRSRRRLKDRP